MKKVILSITVVIFTILSCTYMLTYKVPEKVNYKRSDIKVSKPDDASVKVKTEESTDKKDDKAAAEDTNDSGSSSPDSAIDYPIVEEAKSVFKVSKNSISISSKDKLKLLLIYKKLDKDDEERITEFLNEEDEDSVKNIFHLLRDRLSDDDYQSVRNIASRFINLDVAEN